jgi:hypothetical protein
LIVPRNPACICHPAAPCDDILRSGLIVHFTSSARRGQLAQGYRPHELMWECQARKSYANGVNLLKAAVPSSKSSRVVLPAFVGDNFWVSATPPCLANLRTFMVHTYIGAFSSGFSIQRRFSRALQSFIKQHENMSRLSAFDISRQNCCSERQ